MFIFLSSSLFQSDRSQHGWPPLSLRHQRDRLFVERRLPHTYLGEQLLASSGQLLRLLGTIPTPAAIAAHFARDGAFVDTDL